MLQITKQSKEKKQDIPDERCLVYFYALLSELIAKNRKENNLVKIDTYIEIYSILLKIVFNNKDKESLKAKSIAVLQKNHGFENLVNELFEVKRTSSLISILKFIIYSKSPEDFKSDISQRSIDNLLESAISEVQTERIEALHAFVFMFEVSIFDKVA